MQIAVSLPKQGAKFRDIAVFTALLLLSSQGFLNYFIGQTLLPAWKQVLILICLVISLFRIRTSFDAYLVLYVLTTAALLLLAGSLQGVPTDTLIFNSFYYVSWLPFYLTGRVFNIRRHIDFVRYSSILFIVIGAAGLILQLYTPYFDFLKDQEAAELRTRFGETQRFGFVFVTSTLVMPTLAGIYYLYLLAPTSAFARLRAQAALVLAVLPTGSLAGLIMLMGTFGMTLSRLRSSAVIPFVVGFLLIASAAVPFGGVLVERQIQRMTSNTIETDSNQTRLALWRYAIDTVLDFPIEKQLFGAGLGVTNSNRASAALYAHGESSFFQALIEGGLIGLSLRLLPFGLLFAARLPRRDHLMNVAYGGALFVCCASAPLFGGFGLQCLLGFNAGICQQLSRRSED